MFWATILKNYCHVITEISALEFILLQSLAQKSS